MARFAEIDNSNKILRVLVVDDKDTQDEDGNEVESVGAKYLSDGFGGTWKRTSYNTNLGIHSLGGTPFRKNYAGKGYTFDESRDAFIPPRPVDLDGDVCNSWVLDESTCQWNAPISEPLYTAEMEAAGNQHWRWDESLHQTDNTAGWVVTVIGDHVG